jgi:hypothetical protein
MTRIAIDGLDFIKTNEIRKNVITRLLKYPPKMNPNSFGSVSLCSISLLSLLACADGQCRMELTRIARHVN